MVVSIVLSLLMAIVIFFFVVMMDNGSAMSIIYGLFLLYLFVRMTFAENKSKGSGVKYRRIFQIVFAIFFCISFIAQLYDERGSMAITSDAMSNAEIPFCHIVIPQALIPFLLTKNIIFPARISGHFAAISGMLVIWLIITFTVGRGWCSWICFYGGWEEGFSHISKKPRLKLLPRNKEIREFQFGFFCFIVLVSLGFMSAVYCSWFCPFKLVTEFSPVDSIPNLIGAVMFIGLFLALVVIMPILSRRRFQCSTICPFGAFMSLTDRLSMFKMKIDTDKCKGCLKCAQSCSFGAIDIKTITEKKGHPEINCAKCGECVDACPEKAISYAFRFTGKCSKPEPVTKAAKILQGFLDPGQLFRFSAFTLGAVMSSNFVIDAMNRIFDFIKGFAL